MTADAITVHSDHRTLSPRTLTPIHLHFDGGDYRAVLMLRRRSRRGYTATTQPAGWEVAWSGRTPKGWTREFSRKFAAEADARVFIAQKFEDVLSWVKEKT